VKIPTIFTTRRGAAISATRSVLFATYYVIYRPQGFLPKEASKYSERADEILLSLLYSHLSWY